MGQEGLSRGLIFLDLFWEATEHLFCHRKCLQESEQVLVILHCIYSMHCILRDPVSLLHFWEAAAWLYLSPMPRPVPSLPATFTTFSTFTTFIKYTISYI